MKRGLLLILSIGILAGQASGALYYTLDADTAMEFTHFTVNGSDWGGALLGPTTSVSSYTAPMQGEVGWIGWLMDVAGDSDSLATMTVSASGNAGLSGPYDGFRAFLANDDDDPWYVQLFVQTSGGTFTSDSFVPLAPGTHTTLTTTGPFNFEDVSGFGFNVQGLFVPNGSPSNPDAFKISAVPVPGAVLLGLLGLAVAGLKLRQAV